MGCVVEPVAGNPRLPSDVTVTVKDKPYDVGVDPYNKMIDRVSTDNRKQVSFE